MRIDSHYRRRIRIQCDPNEPFGMRTLVKDLETGEEIINIARITIMLVAREHNIAQVTYANDTGETGTITMEDVGLDIAVHEQ